MYVKVLVVFVYIFGLSVAESRALVSPRTSMHVPGKNPQATRGHVMLVRPTPHAVPLRSKLAI